MQNFYKPICNVCKDNISIAIVPYYDFEDRPHCSVHCMNISNDKIIKDKEWQLKDKTDDGRVPTPFTTTNPEHYHSHEIDPIEYLKRGFPKEVFAGFCIGNIIKYTSRFDKKNGMEDLEKAMDYMVRLIDWRSEKW